MTVQTGPSVTLAKLQMPLKESGQNLPNSRNIISSESPISSRGMLFF